MSKSRGNVVLPEEVVKGVFDLDPRFEFRDLKGEIVDWKVKGVWFHDDGYRTSTKFKRQPVFLHQKGNPVPVWLTTMDTVQHVNEHEFWQEPLETQ
ncbi:MAG: hypothetical protein ACYS7Y_12015 [Planctomycetota bacterium]|jgi:hypothetical protein